VAGTTCSNNLSDSPSQTAAYRMLLDSNDGSGVRRSANGIDIQRHDRRHVHHARRNPTFLKQRRSSDRSTHHNPVRDYRDIGAFPVSFRATNFEFGVGWSRQLGYRHATDPKEYGALYCRRCFNGAHGLPRIRGHDDGQVGEQPQPSYVLDRVMSCAKLSISDAARLPHELYVGV
jgi:hypothetical protein